MSKNRLFQGWRCALLLLAMAPLACTGEDSPLSIGRSGSIQLQVVRSAPDPAAVREPAGRRDGAPVVAARSRDNALLVRVYHPDQGRETEQQLQFNETRQVFEGRLVVKAESGKSVALDVFQDTTRTALVEFGLTRNVSVDADRTTTVDLTLIPVVASVLSLPETAVINAPFIVTWSSVPLGSVPTQYSLEEDDQVGFTSPTEVYRGTATQTTLTRSATGRLYYRVRAFNAFTAGTFSSNKPTIQVVSAAEGIPPEAVRDLAAGTPTANSITLTWTAPGDDGNVGTAAEYDVRYSTSTISEGNWASATPAAGEPAPRAAGSSETFAVTGLLENTAYFFALKTRDEVPNPSEISNVATGATLDTTPPAAVLNLAAGTPTANSITLTWTAPGDDGNVGTAAEYDVRYSTSTLSEGNWASATQAAGEPAPRAAGSSEAFTLTGLQPNTTYYFALKTRDERGNESPISNGATGATLDTTPPGAVTDLAVNRSTSASITLTWTAPGDDGNVGTAAEYDVRYSTSTISEGNWASATQATGEPSPQAAGSNETFTVTGLQSNMTYYFTLKTRDERSNESGLSNVATSATLDTTPPAAVLNLAANTPTANSIRLTWTAPGDDGNSGTAAEYDVRYSTSSITEGNWATAAPAAGEPAPQAAGSDEAFIVTGLLENTTYFFALKARDERSNEAAISNVATDTTLDRTPPAAVTDLAVIGSTSGSITLAWTAPGDDGNAGTAAEYDVRYSTSTISEGNWASATQAAGEPAPRAAGSSDTFNLTGLQSNTTYFFALKSRDERGNESPISNVATGATLDTTPPAAVLNLAAGTPTANSITLTWTAPGDDGNVGTAAEYDVRYSTSTLSEENWASASQAAGEPAPRAAGGTETFTVTGLQSNTTYFFALKTRDERANESPISIGATGATLDTTPPAAVLNLAASTPTASSIGLTWTAPGDDGSIGTAAVYDVRYATTMITEANWAAATQATGEPSPQAAGSNETFTVTGLQSNTTYYFALKTRDERPNESVVSNVATGTTLDVTPPSAVSNLAASTPTANSIRLTWTAPGDDGGLGTAAVYDVRYSTTSITEGNWAAATQATGEPAPQAAGGSETFTVIGLQPNTTYFFALKTRDERANESPISNGATGSTVDATPPEGVTDLAVSSSTSAAIGLTWTAPGDDGNVGTASVYDVRYSTSSITEGNWPSATPATGEPTPRLAGSNETFAVNGLLENTTYFFALKSRDERGNESTISNVATGTTLDTTPPAAVVNLAAGLPTANSITLTWTAPGDDGSTGTPSVYDVRYSTASITAGSWPSATPATGEPTPRIAGSNETYTVNGLQESTTYYFALKTRDERGNESTISNVATGTTVDVTSPAAVIDLATGTPTISSIRLTWTAPGDDGAVGTASGYDIRYSTAVITSINWVSATVVPGEPAPKPGGSSEQFTVTGLQTNTTYYFALKSRDEVANESGISNVVTAKTAAPELGMIAVPVPRTFTMGSPPAEAGRGPDETEHQVTLTRPYSISDHEVTQGEWLATMGWNESTKTGSLTLPVETITWYDALEFCNRKSAAEFLTPAYVITNPTMSGNHIVSASVAWPTRTATGYRLPTEAEWEAACRAGTQTAFANGGITIPSSCPAPLDPNLDVMGWYCGNASSTTHAVKLKAANALGLYDMHGNVWEWCWDSLDEPIADYPPSSATDPEGPPTGPKRAIRGGGYIGEARVCRSADRDNGAPSSTFFTTGLRLAR